MYHLRGSIEHHVGKTSTAVGAAIPGIYAIASAGSEILAGKPRPKGMEINKHSFPPQHDLLLLYILPLRPVSCTSVNCFDPDRTREECNRLVIHISQRHCVLVYLYSSFKAVTEPSLDIGDSLANIVLHNSTSPHRQQIFLTLRHLRSSLRTSLSDSSPIITTNRVRINLLKALGVIHSEHLEICPPQQMCSTSSVTQR